MALSIAQRLDRIRVRTDELTWWREREAVPIGGWRINGASILAGAPWPISEGVVQFAAAVSAPEHWPLSEARLQLDLGGEGLVGVHYADGQTQSFGSDPYHREFPVRGRQMRITSETVARRPFGEPVRHPVLGGGALVWLDLPVNALHLRLRQIYEAGVALDGHEVVPHLVAAAETAFHALDWPSASEDYVARFAPSPGQQRIWQLPPLKQKPAALTEHQRQSVFEADAALVEALRALQQRFPPQGELLLTGHAHIDLAWLWPYAETRRKMRRTFHTALSLMEGGNEYLASSGLRFNQSSAQYYAQVAEDDPALFEAIRANVKAGGWETIGGMWVEPDTNMPTGESLARQLLYGQRYFAQTFGVRHSVCWLPDCFGFSGALPQLLKQAGIGSFFTIKVNWSETNRFPADLFWWEGIDGSRVLAHTFDNPNGGYNGVLNPGTFLQTWRNFRQKPLHGQSLLAVGYGDGGGGVTPEMVEREMQLRDFPALPRARWGRVEDYFAAAHEAARARPLPVWQGDIYLELHRGTLTSQGAVKKLHRRAERGLITAETIGALAALLGAELAPSLEPAWRTLLKNEFHDILPGSSIAEVYADARRELQGVLDAAGAEQEAALRRLVGRLPAGKATHVVVNPSLCARRLGTGTIPPLAIVAAEDLPAAPHVAVAERMLVNDWLKVTIAGDGTIAGIVHQPTGRQALAGRGNQLWAYPADKTRNWDAWDIEDDYAASGIELVADEIGPGGGGIRVVRRYRHSTITQTYVLEGPRLEVRTELDWHDRHVLLRTLTPVAVRATHATFEHAYGVVRRATHDNTSWDRAQFEVPGHRFLDLSEPGFGVALLNDAKYGHSAKGNLLGLSLVRSPVYPDPLADEGAHSFTYALYPHAGDWHEGGVREEAEDLNQPLILTTAPEGVAPGVHTPLKVRGIGAALSGFKLSEDGRSLIFRVYEPAGGRGACDLVLPEGWRNDGVVSILEEPMEAGPGLLPFEVRSFRLTRS